MVAAWKLEWVWSWAVESRVFYLWKLAWRRRSELAITDTELKLIAAAAAFEPIIALIDPATGEVVKRIDWEKGHALSKRRLTFHPEAALWQAQMATRSASWIPPPDGL